MAENAIERLAAAIGYPEPVPAGAERYVFGVDDAEVTASISDGRLTLSRVLWTEPEGEAESSVPRRAAELAAGRVFREDAVLAWDEATKTLGLSQDVPASLSSDWLLKFFEVFTASCDWWLERIREESEPKPVFPEMMIVP